MNDDLDDERTLGDYLGIMRRRWRLGAISFVLVFVAGAALALLLPPVYRSTATILIEQQEIPQDLVRSTITSFADQRIQLINQRVMTTPNLLEIIREHGLYADDIDSKPREVIIERMRKDIHMNMISANVVDPRSGAPTAATIAFTVGYDNRNAELAVRVANELTSLYLQQNSQTRRQQAAEASSFLASEAKRLSEEISVLSQKLADFKRANGDRLPELSQFNMQLVSRAEQELADVRRDRSVIEQRRVYLDAQLAQLSPTRDFVSNGNVVMSPADRLRTLESALASMRGVYTADHPDVVRTERMIAVLRDELGVTEDETNGLEREVETLRAQRTELLERYNELHPDVVRIDRQIAAATERLGAASTKDVDPNADEPRADNPLYLQLVSQRAGDVVQLNMLAAKETELHRQLAEVENRLLQTPAVERDYYALGRDLDNARLKYQEVSAKQMEAVVSENLENDAKAERFNLIEPPLLPQRPVAPNRQLIVLLGAALAVAAGLAAVALREAFDDSVHGPRELERLTRMVPIGVIPAIATPGDLKTRRRQRAGFAVATAGVLIALVVLAHLFVAPVDMLWLAALRRFGV